MELRLQDLREVELVREQEMRTGLSWLAAVPQRSTVFVYKLVEAEEAT